GKASRWVRMAQPYAGSNHGLHFPLHKGTEVILTHIDGDPDRPIIAGAVPNAETQAIVRDENQTTAGFRTAGGNEMYMEDSAGSQKIVLTPGGCGAYLRLGSTSPGNNGGGGSGEAVASPSSGGDTPAATPPPAATPTESNVEA